MNNKNIYLTLLFLTSVFGTVIHVGAGQGLQLIQEGIDSAQAGDTVLVDDGLYFENLRLNKEIVLASRVIFDDPGSWQNNPHVMNTIIDGSAASPEAIYGSCLAIVPPLDPGGLPLPISPLITGFTLQHGIGTRVTQISPFNDNFIQHPRLGGGVLIAGVTPVFKYNRFMENGLSNRAAGVAKGGAAYAGTDVDIDEIRPGLNFQGQLFRNDSLSFAHNLFLSNTAAMGRTIFVEGYAGALDVRDCFFDVFDCDHETVSTTWVASGSPGLEFDFALGEGLICALTQDVWVSPTGDDMGGTGSPDQPFKTITHAFEMISGTPENPIGIHLFPGFYAPFENGEQFPLNLPDDCFLLGDPAGPVIIDADSTERVLTLMNLGNAHLERIAITGGQTANGGGGISLWNSNLELLNVTLAGNSALSGGGIYAENSEVHLVNTIVWDNTVPQLHFNGQRLPSRCVVAFSDIQGGQNGIYSNLPDNLFWLDGNLSQWPQFIGEFCLDDASPCVDAGAQNMTLVYNAGQDTLFIPPLPFSGDNPDMGSCENPGGTPLMGDLDQNGELNIVDIVIMVDLTLNGGATPFEMLVGDLDESGEINIVDIVLLVGIILDTQG
ncbi:MAG: DUF1565 domain-containing protein [FCB group bacterium]|nr:DUF1565 domain-containing protein [FCB group bacterium]